MATVTVAVTKCHHVGDRKKVIGTATVTGTNTTGGNLGASSATMAALIGLDSIDSIELEPGEVTGGFLFGRYRPSNGSIQLLSPVDASPAANELTPEMGAVAIPGGPVNFPFTAYGKGGTVAPQGG